MYSFSFHLSSPRHSLTSLCSYEGPELEMWSLGVLLYTLLFSENPFCGVEEILRAKLKPPFPLSSGTLLNQSSAQQPHPSVWKRLSIVIQQITVCAFNGIYWFYSRLLILSLFSQTWLMCCTGCWTLIPNKGWLWTTCCCSPGLVSTFHCQSTAGPRSSLHLRVMVSILLLWYIHLFRAMSCSSSKGYTV